MPSKMEAQKAVETLLTWIGENPQREGIRDTPQRVIDAYQEFFSGYQEDPQKILKEGFSEIDGYHDIVLLEKTPFSSHCEHHMIPFFGHATIAYEPNEKVVGFSRLIRVLEVYSRRLQVQERLTEQVAKAIWETLKPKGIAVVLEAQHLCMSMRGIKQTGVLVKTQSFYGSFAEQDMQEKLFRMRQSM